MLVSLTVGKVDAGVAVLLTQDNRLVSFSPSPLSQQLVARPTYELPLHVFKDILNIIWTPTRVPYNPE